MCGYLFKRITIVIGYGQLIRSKQAFIGLMLLSPFKSPEFDK